MIHNECDFSLVFWAVLVLELVFIHFCYFWALSSLVSPWPHMNVELQISPSHHIQMKSIVLRIVQKVHNQSGFQESQYIIKVHWSLYLLSCQKFDSQQCAGVLEQHLANYHHTLWLVQLAWQVKTGYSL